MLEVHRSNNGVKCFISQMGDEHLKNTILLRLERIRKLCNAIDSRVKIGKLKSSLYGINEKYVSEKASEMVRNNVLMLYPYLAEAMLRGFSYTEELRQIFQRDGKEETFDIEVDDVRSLVYEDFKDFQDGDDK